MRMVRRRAQQTAVEQWQASLSSTRRSRRDDDDDGSEDELASPSKKGISDVATSPGRGRRAAAIAAAVAVSAAAKAEDTSRQTRTRSSPRNSPYKSTAAASSPKSSPSKRRRLVNDDDDEDDFDDGPADPISRSRRALFISSPSKDVRKEEEEEGDDDYQSSGDATSDSSDYESVSSDIDERPPVASSPRRNARKQPATRPLSSSPRKAPRRHRVFEGTADAEEQHGEEEEDEDNEEFVDAVEDQADLPASVMASPARRARRRPHVSLSLPLRSTPRSTLSANLLEHARDQLHTGAVPESMPCRAAERDRIASFVRECVTRGAGKCLYVSGMPGTGKTATVHQVIRELTTEAEAEKGKGSSEQDDGEENATATRRRRRTDGPLPPFQFVELNAMRMTEPAQAYSLLLHALTGERATPSQALDRLDDLFSGPRRRRARMAVVLVDEMDLLVTRKQTVIYNLFDWPHRPHARLAVIAVANTMDLPERTLLPRVSSRLGLLRTVFASYTHTELIDIIQARLGTSRDAFHSDAIELCARKVAQISGDARRALDVCRRAVEIACDQRSQVVGVQHVSAAYSQMFNSATAAVILHSSKYERILLCVLCAAVRHTGLPETTYQALADRFVNGLRVNGLPVPNTSEIFAMCGRLGARRLLLFESPLLDIYQRVRLNVSEDDVKFALAADPAVQPFIAH